jgi:hypothetical protein
MLILLRCECPYVFNLFGKTFIPDFVIEHEEKFLGEIELEGDLNNNHQGAQTRENQIPRHPHIRIKVE